MRALWKILSMRCAEADALAARGRAGCTRMEWIALTVHRWVCKGCRAAARQIEALQRGLETLRESPPESLPIDLSPEARERLERAVREKRESL